MKITEQKVKLQQQRVYECKNLLSGKVLLSVLATETEFPKEVDISVMKYDGINFNSDVEKFENDLVQVESVINEIMLDFPELRNATNLNIFNQKQKTNKDNSIECELKSQNEVICIVLLDKNKKLKQIKQKKNLKVSEIHQLVRFLRKTLNNA